MDQNFLDYALSIQQIKKVEMVMPIIKKMGVLTPLVVGDDLSLKTTISTPQYYDREICNLIYKHLIEINDNEGVSNPKSYNDFITNLSNVDKICLLFGLYKITYENFGKRKIRCDNVKQKCSETFIIDLHADDLFHEDSLCTWEEAQDFTEFIYEISIEQDDYKYIFGTRLPSIKDHNNILSFIDSEKIQYHIENLGNLFSLPEQMTLLTKYIKIGETKSDVSTYNYTENIQEILITFTSAIPKRIQKEFFDKYNKKFGKYNPNFYKIAVCPKCGKEQQRTVNVELEFFRRSVSDEEEE
ncbi:MAG: DUF2225 domain-containing protein [bacterium]